MKKCLLFCFMFLCFNINVYASDKIEVQLKKCVDGDTARFIYKNEEIKARFLAIDTPESVHPTKESEPFGKEASEYTCQKLTNANKIVLEYDPKSDKTDKYDRHLVWVYVDDMLLQKDLISKGYAKVEYIYGKYKYLDELEIIEQEAKSEKLGIWSVEEDKNTVTNEDLKSLFTSVFEILKKFINFLDRIVNDVL